VSSAGLRVTADVGENTRELRSVIRVVRAYCQRVQACDGGIDLTQFRFDLGEMACAYAVTRPIHLRKHERQGGERRFVLEPNPIILYRPDNHRI